MSKLSQMMFVMLLFSMTGCTHLQLQKSTIHNMQTINELHRQQVLDNLAMFVHDINSVPSFAYLGSSVTEVNDKVGLSSTNTWQRLLSVGATIVSHGWASTTAVPSGERALKGNWTVTPINDPRRLELMRCAYQTAVQSCLQRVDGTPTPSTFCPDCDKRFKEFYTGDINGEIPFPGTDKDKGITTNHCFNCDCCWFGCGKRRDVPKDCDLVGCYKGTYVWVPQEWSGVLARLELAILDYAVNAPATKSRFTKEVILYLDHSLEEVTTRENANAELRIVLDRDYSVKKFAAYEKMLPDTLTETADLQRLLHDRAANKVMSIEDAQRLNQFLRDAPPDIEFQRPPSLDERRTLDLIQLQQRLDTVRSPQP